eukprot:Rmarinus@m.29591
MNVLYLFSNATSLPHPERSFNVDRALLLGPAGSAKTSLLVQYATSVSAYQGDVIFLTSKMSMRSVHKPRVDVQGSELMTRVHVKYVVKLCFLSFSCHRESNSRRSNSYELSSTRPTTSSDICQ